MGVLVSATSKLPLILGGYPVVAHRPGRGKNRYLAVLPPEEDASRLRRLLHVQPVKGKASRYPHERDASPASEGHRTKPQPQATPPSKGPCSDGSSDTFPKRRQRWLSPEALSTISQ